MSNLQVLISGGGVAGPIAAYFLARGGASVTIVERSPSLRSAGQNVDIRGAAVQVIRRMSLEDEVRKQHTTEEGLKWVDAENKSKADFPADKSGETETFTADIEILRSKLSELLFNATKDSVNYVFGDYITAIEQSESKAHVTFNKAAPQDYDVVIGADGLGSKTRALVFGPERSKEYVKPLGMWSSFFTIPQADTDGTWCRWYNAPGRRTIMIRPDNQGTARAFLSTMTPNPKLDEVLTDSISEQKALMHELFADADWEAERVLAGMDTAEDFYMDQVAQVKMPSWSLSRAVLIGDAAYGPSFITGMGTSLGIVGAYIIAGELTKHSTDLPAALAAYEKIMRPFVNKAQALFPGAPGIANPDTPFGIKMLHGVLGFASWSGIVKVLGKMGIGGPPADAVSMPDYGL